MTNEMVGKEKELTVKIICVDEVADEDLMFDQALVRSLGRLNSRGPIILVVGSGESVGRGLSRQGHEDGRVKGGLQLKSEQSRDEYERLMRDKGRDYVQLLTDAGISSVGFFGADRNMLSLRPGEKGVVCKAGTIVGLSRSGVLSVIMCACRASEGSVLDLQPMECCIAIRKALEAD